MTLEYVDDPRRYCSSYALVTTPAELALRRDIATLLSDKLQHLTLTGEERERIAAMLRDSRAAALKAPEVPDVV